ncbi:sigma-E processing peptidase SpoIIGA [Fictibacillus macauensis ZFHKF-1]|uniref:Sporulation sigma-E factor-processing peptidase n=1 Tax=Fictibacillus macauensis ZFHKF-1 TaxID=1196324 RepID=I8UDY1_9BACL|nr:sigma-E processing peptidase SpoIIGA [Fictibacillus macauensis]EIT85003.1 sigma-E processing peptidase SpoIIGA [Fictibacillus macauensis ZFHKF-1]
MTIYLDVIWFLNFCIDFLLIMLTGLILKRNIKKRRVIAGAAIGSFYVVLLFMPLAINMYHPLVKFMFSMLIMMIAFGFRNFSFFFKNVAMFYFVTFVTGGGLFALHYFLQQDLLIPGGVLAANPSGSGDVLSWAFVVIGFPLLWLFSKKRVDDIKVQKIHYSETVNVTVIIDDCQIEATGLIDSGNKLHDPITKVPVMILDLTAHENYFPKEVLDFAKNIHTFSSDEESNWVSRFRIVPYRAVGKEHAFLASIKPDKIIVSGNHGTFVCEKVLVGLTYTALSNEGHFSCIVHPEVIANGIEQIVAS